MNRAPGPPSSPSVPSSPLAGASPASTAPASFEDAVKRLSEIVQTLERGDLPLEESLRLFEEGVRLSRVSQERLDVAQRRVEQLLGVDAQGRARTEPFQTQATGDEEDDKLPF
jgi:exodeoxyribonuclease VII small subunit